MAICGLFAWGWLGLAELKCKKWVNLNCRKVAGEGILQGVEMRPKFLPCR